MEYASPDAVRRGGGPREPANEPGGNGGVGRGGRVRKPKNAGYIRKEPESTAGQLTKNGERRLNKTEKTEKEERKLEKKLKRGFGGERVSGKGERPKPGAALALAQRGTAAILPSQGQKITF